MSAVSAELTKLASNSFLAQRVSSINTRATMCEKVGADIKDVGLTIGLDPRIEPHALQADTGYDGSCLTTDLLRLCDTAGSSGLEEIASYWQQVDLMNTYQKTRVTSLLLDQLPQPLSECKVSVVGFSFKPNTMDTRDTVAAAIVAKMVRKGLLVSIFDPHMPSKQIWQELEQHGLASGANDSKIILESSIYSCCNNANAIFIHTNWDMLCIEGPVCWATISQRMQHPKLYFSNFDTNEPHVMEAFGFTVTKVGRRNAVSTSTPESSGFL